MNRRGFLWSLGGLIVASQEPVRIYSFLWNNPLTGAGRQLLTMSEWSRVMKSRYPAEKMSELLKYDTFIWAVREHGRRGGTIT